MLFSKCHSTQTLSAETDKLLRDVTAEAETLRDFFVANEPNATELENVLSKLLEKWMKY